LLYQISLSGNRPRQLY